MRRGWRGKGKRGLTESQGREEKRESGERQREGVWMFERGTTRWRNQRRSQALHTHTNPHRDTTSPTSQQDPIQLSSPPSHLPCPEHVTSSSHVAWHDPYWFSLHGSQCGPAWPSWHSLFAHSAGMLHDGPAQPTLQMHEPSIPEHLHPPHPS